MDEPLLITQNRIIDLSMEDRPREKALTQGVGALTTTELIALLLSSGSRGESVIHLSQRILHDCDNSLRLLSMRTIDNLIRSFKGVGEAKAITLLAAIELGKRYAQEGQLETPAITTTYQAYAFMTDKLFGLDHEEFWVVYLNQAHKVLRRVRVGQGGVTGTVVDMKIILRNAIDYLATAIILYHNHPSGAIRPSEKDDKITRNLKAACETLDIKLIDHIIIGNEDYYSYVNADRL